MINNCTEKAEFIDQEKGGSTEEILLRRVRRLTARVDRLETLVEKQKKMYLGIDRETNKGTKE